MISMEICLADEIREAEFDLIDRRALNYPVLLGRKALAGYVVVDPARAYLTKAVCGHTKRKKGSEPADRAAARMKTASVSAGIHTVSCGIGAGLLQSCGNRPAFDCL